MQFTDYDIECIKNAKLIIDAHLEKHYRIEFLAAKVNIGATKLKSGFHQYYGLGLFTYLRKQRMIKAEIITASFLAIDQMQRSGLWLVAFLMTTFTIYVAGMLLLKSSLLCTCGGVVSSMTWKQHLWFNIFFMLLSWNALLHYYNPANKIISANKKEGS